MTDPETEIDVMTPRVRRALPSEAELLSALALRSKAMWGYDEEFVRRCAPLLTVRAASMRSRLVFVAELDGEVAGFYALGPRGEELEVDLLFIDPSFVRGGLGRLLLEHALEEAAALGRDRLLVESDPFAEPFYLRMGARRIGSVASMIEPGRELPLLAFDLRRHGRHGGGRGVASEPQVEA